MNTRAGAKVLITAALAAMAVPLFGGSYSYSGMSWTDSVSPGQWTSRYADAKAYAKKNYVPMVVVCVRIRRRRAQNAERHRKWLEEGGVARIRPRPAKSARVASAEPDEQIFFHEKGTLYVGLGAPGFDAAVHQDRPTGRPSDVAFPGFRRVCHVCQRTHCYITNKRMAFGGKDLALGISFAELGKCTVMPGGIVFETGCGASAASFAFTFQNPLIAVDILRFARNG